MDDYGINENYLPKLLIGVVIGLIIVLFAVPLVVDAVSNMVVADAANQTLADLNDSSNSATIDNIKSNEENTPQTASTPVTDTQSSGEVDNTPSVSNMQILSGSITTGSSLSSKSTCKVYVGQEYSGANVKISTLYSRDGSDLNNGNIVAKTVDSSGYVSVNSASAFKLYPDMCVVTLYDSSNNVLDSYTTYLDTTSGTQYF